LEEEEDSVTTMMLRGGGAGVCDGTVVLVVGLH
jgi:hypothetical protein